MLNCFIKTSHFRSFFFDEKQNGLSHRKNKKTWNLLSAPAPSIMGRIEIYYKDDSIVISPRDFDELKNELLRINPNITVKE